MGLWYKEITLVLQTKNSGLIPDSSTNCPKQDTKRLGFKSCKVPVNNWERKSTQLSIGGTHMTDKTIQCRDCGDEFVFTEGEQEFYAERDFNDPIRCPDCRRARKAQRQQ